MASLWGRDRSEQFVGAQRWKRPKRITAPQVALNVCLSNDKWADIAEQMSKNGADSSSPLRGTSHLGRLLAVTWLRFEGKSYEKGKLRGTTAVCLSQPLMWVFEGERSSHESAINSNSNRESTAEA